MIRWDRFYKKNTLKGIRIIRWSIWLYFCSLCSWLSCIGTWARLLQRRLITHTVTVKKEHNTWYPFRVLVKAKSQHLLFKFEGWKTLNLKFALRWSQQEQKLPIIKISLSATSIFSPTSSILHKKSRIWSASLKDYRRAQLDNRIFSNKWTNTP